MESRQTKRRGWLEGIIAKNRADMRRLFPDHPFDENGEPLPKPFVASVGDAPTIAALWAKFGVFKSVGEAKRNGWNVPVTAGTHNCGRRTIIVT